jgi:hypothetical protein
MGQIDQGIVMRLRQRKMNCPLYDRPRSLNDDEASRGTEAQGKRENLLT